MDARRKSELLKGKGIYGITNRYGELLYIGMTMRTFKQRWTQHEECVRHWGYEDCRKRQKGCHKLYDELSRILEKGDDYYFEIILTVTDIKNICGVRKVDKEMIERFETTLISHLNPRCNVRDNEPNQRFSFLNLRTMNRVDKLIARRNQKTENKSEQKK